MIGATMHPALLLLAVAGALLLALVVVLLVDFILYQRTRTAELRRFRLQRHLKPNHMAFDALGDPATCWDPEHVHNPQDFDARFRSRHGASVRMLAVVALTVLAAAALIGAGGLGLTALVIG